MCVYIQETKHVSFVVHLLKKWDFGYIVNKMKRFQFGFICKKVNDNS